jgi:hypothetical protein
VLRVRLVDRDLLVGQYLLADALRFDRPDVRFPELFSGVAPGDTVSLRIDAARDGAPRVAVNDGDPLIEGFTAGRGWGLVYFSDLVPLTVARVIDHLWVAAILFSVAAVTPSLAPALVAGAAILATLGLVPLVSPLVTTPLTHHVAGVIGLLAARAARAVPPTSRRGLATDPAASGSAVPVHLGRR